MLPLERLGNKEKEWIKMKSFIKMLLAIATKVLTPFGRVFLGKDKAKLPIRFTYGRDSYTDGETFINVSVDEEMVEKLKSNKTELLRHLKFKMWHECCHCLYTNRFQYKVLVDKISNLWRSMLPEDKGFKCSPEQLAGDLLNCLCDGRCENQGLKRDRSWLKYRNRIRLYRWMEYDIREAEEKPSRYNLLRNGALSIATTGLMPRGYEEVAEEEYKVLLDLAPVIGKYVASPTIKAGEEYALEVAKALYPEEMTCDKEDMESGESGSGEIPEDILDLIREFLENGGLENFGKDGETLEGPDDGMCIAILTDDTPDSEGSAEEGKKPDMVIDLRKGKGESLEPSTEESEEKSKGAGSGTEGETSDDEGEGESPDDSKGSGSSKEMEGSADSSRDDSSSEETEGVDTPKGSGSSKDTDGSETTKSSSKEAESGEKEESTDTSETSSSDIEKAVEEALKKAERDLTSSDRDTLRKFEREEKEFEYLELQRKGYSSDDITSLGKLDFPARKKGIVEVKEVFYDFRKKIAPNGEILRKAKRNCNKLKNLIASKSRPNRYNTFDGEIDPSSLDRFIVGQGDIFVSQGRKVDPDICCLILKDNSGSMSGVNEVNCLKALEEIEETFKSLFPMRIETFSYLFNSDVELHRVIKNWDEKGSHSYTKSYQSHQDYKVDEDNYDAFSIALATKQLMRRKEKNKLLIVLSDGEPACRRQESSLESVNRAVKYARKNGIFVCSFFFGSERFVSSNQENYRKMYENYYVGCSLDKIGDNLIRFVKAFINKAIR